MDPISMILTVGIAFGAWALGYAMGRKQRTASAVPPIPRADCEGCEHNLSFHDDNGVCQQQIKQEKYFKGLFTGYEYVRCSCQQYLGHIPHDRLLATFNRDLPAVAPPKTDPTNVDERHWQDPKRHDK